VGRPARGNSQFFDLSTSAFSLIQGIMSRRLLADILDLVSVVVARGLP
jgi:hypothetical protein